MGKKLMEVIELKKGLKTSKATIKLLDTGFSQLTRKIGSDPGADYTTIEDGDILSKEVLVSLNQKQLELKARYETLISAYNTWINNNKIKITGLTNFSYNFTALTDYSSGYEAGITPADYYMLTEIVNAEKELYELGNFWYLNHLEENIELIKTWSKTQNYGSTTSKVIGYFETFWGRTPYCISCNISEVTYSNVGGGDDKVYVHATNLQNIPDGSTAKFTIRASYEAGSHDDSYTVYEYGYMYIKRTVIDNDSYYTCTATKGTLKDHGYISGYERTGATATHFDTESPTLEWLNNRTYL